ncbi:hypothetical protein OC834_007912, partial [Tilletia horrida]
DKLWLSAAPSSAEEAESAPAAGPSRRTGPFSSRRIYIPPRIQLSPAPWEHSDGRDHLPERSLPDFDRLRRASRNPSLTPLARPEEPDPLDSGHPGTSSSGDEELVRALNKQKLLIRAERIRANAVAEEAQARTERPLHFDSRGFLISSPPEEITHASSDSILANSTPLRSPGAIHTHITTRQADEESTNYHLSSDPIFDMMNSSSQPIPPPAPHPLAA